MNKNAVVKIVSTVTEDGGSIDTHTIQAGREWI